MQLLTNWQTQFCNKWQLPHDYIEGVNPALDWFKSTISEVPFPLSIAISGCQGSGKSTLSAYFVEYLKSQGVSAEAVSLDDFYLSKHSRQALARRLHPEFETRGAPGTHNIKAACSVVERFKRKQAFVLPRFDKSTDDPFSEDKWTEVKKPIDVLIFEGWCLGLPAQPETLLTSTCNQFELLHDQDGSYRKAVNEFLAGDYQSLFCQFDKLLFLNGQSFEHVFNWRLEQENKLITKTGRGMSAQQVSKFIQSYQRLTEWGINQLPNLCDFEVTLDSHRKTAIR
ncbi:kinase [Pseudoalteromonas sp. SMS1]|uniref:kinase n=1 Tax=Pseudoalteromonas sp. SMS1 TaxID=2908894 RepID=UPI001F374E74|nr:kinase [Pseudoalteromonas sp. SMS1]MCF2858256.1 kinase [Pseudoalteromonas sp. SMS1]